ncbi:MAG TPA: response regulator [Oligoflexus sp.]|uniref:response regulator n=1 Tax=Oligoflexus sp. TaxID=1971216 RepID=UPI002D5F4C5E|nr:response regulator [Oligoflexus sp.]HYX33149.1 response regulator [Oligoflexus sp.]
MIVSIPYKVAILDDDHFHRKVLERLCGAFPWVKTYSYAYPSEALEAIQQERIPIVLVDINMPGMYGDDVLRHCMALKQGIQVYVITGAENMVIANRCLDLGARIIIRKPVTDEVIAEALQDAKIHLDRCSDTIKKFARRKKEV